MAAAAPYAAVAFVAAAPDSVVVQDRIHKKYSASEVGSWRHHSHMLAMIECPMAWSCCAGPLLVLAPCEFAAENFVEAHKQSVTAVTENQI